MKVKAGKYLVDCYWYRRVDFTFRRILSDYRIHIAWLVIDITDMSVSVDKFVEWE